MFKKRAHKIVWIDGTHNINYFKFQLITFLVAGNFNYGYPIPHFVCKRTDKLLLRPFFQAINDRCDPDIKDNALMSDDDIAGWNAFSSVFGNLYHLLCKWHVKRA